MVNGATIQPVIPSPADKVQSSNSKPGDTTFQDMMNKTADQKTEETNGTNEKDDKQKSTPITDALAQLFFRPEESLLDSNLPKVNEAGITVVMNEVTEEALGLETESKDVNASELKGETSDVFAEEVKDAVGTKSEALAEEMTIPVGKEQTVRNDTTVKTVQDEGKAVIVNDQTNRTGKTAETATVNTEKISAESTEVIKPLETKAEDSAGKAAAEMEKQNTADAMVYVKPPVQQVSRPETRTTQTVTVNPENPQQMMKDISDSMIKNIVSGKQEFELQLEPLNLGKLSIKVTYEAGKTAVSIICSSAKTLEAMSQNAKEIGTILETRLGTETAIIVEQPEADYLEQYNQQKQESQREQKDQPQRQNNRSDTEQVDFLQQLRLGLI